MRCRKLARGVRVVRRACPAHPAGGPGTPRGAPLRVLISAASGYAWRRPHATGHPGGNALPTRP